MAAPTIVELHPSIVPGYEVNDKGQAATDLAVGNLVVMDGAATPGSGHARVWKKCPAGTVNAQGIVLMNVKAGRTASVGIQGEMEGFSGLVAGDGLFPSASVAGGLDTTPGASAVTNIRAISPTGIRYSFV
jgi:hypothetical protein